MSNALAIVLLTAILAFLLLDYFVLRLDAPLYLARRGLDLLRWAAFWR